VPLWLSGKVTRNETINENIKRSRVRHPAKPGQTFKEKEKNVNTLVSCKTGGFANTRCLEHFRFLPVYGLVTTVNVASCNCKRY
jgi:hypothetical protein